MGFVPPHILKAKAASQDVSAEEREASRRTLGLDAARRAERAGKGVDGDEVKTSGSGAETAAAAAAARGGSTGVEGVEGKKNAEYQILPWGKRRARVPCSHRAVANSKYNGLQQSSAAGKMLGLTLERTPEKTSRKLRQLFIYVLVAMANEYCRSYFLIPPNHPVSETCHGGLTERMGDLGIM
ncbi:hypothetical protein CORC01_13399 [Colletotrichum orchidophilum]|uniref:Uncharacterized protein n=1 Tax=Colletotrichum orchidophilum TaxID=1209926 RepID=A0A1G4AQ39_9PEZI|nr:uncharacterized protein CORC01_13399 [Colletotrichum orchidophilum]OHE91284.1 hypothetical protein CORC01_13399 [Colletotrichum orchidophilum]